MNLFETIDKLPAMIDEYVDREIKKDRIAMIKYIYKYCWLQDDVDAESVLEDFEEQLLKEFEHEKYNE